MGDSYLADAIDAFDTRRGSDDREPPVFYRQISYEELEECVLNVRDSIAEFYLAPQGEISFASVEEALKGKTVQNASAYGLIDAKIASQNGFGPDGSVGGRYGNNAIFDYSGEINGHWYVCDNDFTYPESADKDAFASDSGDGANETDAAAVSEKPEQRDKGRSAKEKGGGTRKPQRNYTVSGGRYRDANARSGQKDKPRAFRYLSACFGGAVAGGIITVLGITLLLPAVGFPKYLYAPTQEIIHKYEIEKVDSPIEAVYEKVSPCVVGIRTVSPLNDFLFGSRQSTAEGSGIIISSDGYILTNNHVISAAAPIYDHAPAGNDGYAPSDAPHIEVTLKRDPETVYRAVLVSRDAKTDLAVIKIEANDLPVAELGDSDLLKPGEMVLAIGNPGGFEHKGSVTNGIISAIDRNAKTSSGKEIGLIQTNAAINSGNSGGALANARGEVIGINVFRADAYSYEGLGFAIPINSARTVAENLITFSYVRGRAKTGIKYYEAFNVNYGDYTRQNPEIPKGVFVESVEPLSGAFKAGVKTGDIITKMKGIKISDYIEMLDLVETLSPGDIIEVEYFRSGEYYAADVEISEDTGD